MLPEGLSPNQHPPYHLYNEEGLCYNSSYHKAEAIHESVDMETFKVATSVQPRQPFQLCYFLRTGPI